MCNFNKQDKQTKEFFHLFMKKSADTVGGVNFFLGMIDELRATKPHPLTTNKCKVVSDKVQIEWNKIIFKDKLDVLQELIILHKSSQDIEFNILDTESIKKKKRVSNVIKALAPVVFSVKPKDTNDGGGFEFKIFEDIDLENGKTKLNPVFIALFFCSIEFTKKALKYEI
ncbi:MAG: hypothetical protein GXO30_01185 [Epsilonproteobacteria bacterium]|nr:hypothetical protein [Campylobacterota bacterium]